RWAKPHRRQLVGRWTLPLPRPIPRRRRSYRPSLGRPGRSQSASRCPRANKPGKRSGSGASSSTSEFGPSTPRGSRSTSEDLPSALPTPSGKPPPAAAGGSLAAAPSQAVSPPTAVVPAVVGPPGAVPECKPLSPRQQAREAKRQRRIQQYERIRALHAEGLSLRKIARAVGVSVKRVLRYVRAERCPDWNPGRQRPTQLDRFAAEVDAWIAQGGRNAAEL